MYMAANRINESLLLVSMRIDPWNMTNIYLNDTTANHWTHLAIATEGKRMYIYKNGERVFAINGNHP